MPICQLGIHQTASLPGLREVRQSALIHELIQAAFSGCCPGQGRMKTSYSSTPASSGGRYHSLINAASSCRLAGSMVAGDSWLKLMRGFMADSGIFEEGV